MKEAMISLPFFLKECRTFHLTKRHTVAKLRQLFTEQRITEDYLSMITSTFMLRHFESSKDKDFVKALNLYAKSVHPDIKTNTDEITYWIDNYTKEFKDKFYVLGFYAGKQLVGYAEFIYIREQRLVIFDYIVVDQRFRKNNVFFQFIEHLRVFVADEKIDLNYLVTEVGYLSKSKEPSSYSQALMRLLKFEGGGIVKAPYYQPKLGLYNYDSEMAAVLMLFSYGKIEEISRETYLSIVHSVFYDYYSRWYSIYKETSKEYNAHIDELFKRIEKETKHMKSIKLNGFKSVPADAALSGTASEIRILKFLVPLLLFAVLLAFLLVGLQAVFSLPLFTLVTVYLICLISVFGVLSIYSETAKYVFNKLLSTFKPFSRRLK